MQLPRVSVIVPNYNHAPYLPQRIESILAQTFQDFELILLDDCSTDASVAMLDRYRDHPKVAHVIVNAANSGSPFRQWDRGIALARGRYVWIAESDDWCEPSFLEAMVDGLEQDPECVVSYCQICHVGDDGRIAWVSQHSRLSEMIEGHDYIRRYLVKGAISNASMALWRRDQYACVPHDFITYRFCGDWLFWIRLAQRGKVHVSGRMLDYFRHHPGNVSGGARRRGFGLVEELRVINLMYNEGLIDERAYQSLFLSRYKAYWRGRRNFDMEFRKPLRTALRSPVSPSVKPWRMLVSALWDSWRPRRR